MKAGLLAWIAVAAMGCQMQETAAVPTREQMVERGRYLVTIGSCNDCHTPFRMGPGGPEPDMTRLLSGHPEEVQVPPPPALSPEGWAWASTATKTAFVGPWGVSHAANLTPDQNAGLGIWDEARFFKTLRDGRHRGDGRPIQPPMPWPAIARTTDEDLKAVFAFLQSIPPIENHVPDYEGPPAEQ